ncbi:acyltransferase family protein [Novosphingobium aquimarinum]|uniref:acyltransferase family protein n=1 Tax=Novosphingobium aquimarinum TaxID=2682494 RepID=UPI001E331C4F|nr:acyltransferase [Novosphingobium aquimarinum]
MPRSPTEPALAEARQPVAGGAGAPTRYVTLDAMRGLAAICVALFHFDIWAMPHGYLAVDFFFVLSGFVLARTYAPRFAQGLGFGRFMVKRIVRLYPLFLLGILLAGLVFALRAEVGAANPMAPAAAWWTFLLGLAMLPSPLDVPLFPLNVPSWSLFFEILANALLALVLLRLPRWALIALIVVCAAGLTPILLAHGSGNIGALWSEIGVASLRTTYSFGFGVLIAGLANLPPRRASWLALFVPAAILVMLALPRTGHAAYDIGMILIGSPLLLWAGSRVQLPGFCLIPASFIGEVSYALYAVHWPMIEPLRDLRDRLAVSPLIADPMFIATMLVLAWLAVRWFDMPLRRRLSAALAGDHSVARKVAAG